MMDTKNPFAMNKDVQAALEKATNPMQKLPFLDADYATFEGLVDLLVITGQIKSKCMVCGNLLFEKKKCICGSESIAHPDARVIEHANRYGSIMSGLVDLLAVDGIIDLENLGIAVKTVHDALRHFGGREDFNEVIAWRRAQIKTRIAQAQKP